jgi:hypothetical protein
MAVLVLAAASRSALVQAQLASTLAADATSDAAPYDEQKDAVATKDEVVVVKQEAKNGVAKVQQEAKNAADKPKADAGKKTLAAKEKPTKKAAAIISGEEAVKQAIVARKRRNVVVNANANANLNPMIQQFTQQGRPLMRSEVLLVYSLFHPSKVQLRALVKGAEAALETTSKEMAEFQQNGAQPAGVLGQAAKNPDWTMKLQEAIAVDFKKQLSPQQFSRYQSEVDKRFADRKAAGLRYLVDAVDRELLLSPKQRDQLTEKLASKWDESWAMYLEYIMYGNQFFPQDVDRVVIPVLDETQKKVWNSTQKVSGFWGFGALWGFQNGEDPLQQLLADDQEKKASDNAQVPAGAARKPAVYMKKAGVRLEAAKKK